MLIPGQQAEFTIHLPYRSDTGGPMRWIAVYVLRNWPVGLAAVIGAVGNAVLAAVPPVMIGQALNSLIVDPPQIQAVGRFALILGGSQLLRGLLQWLRNFSFELIAQRVERDIRSELYISLLGKSMTFHSLQPVGDTMARATNDVREVNFLFSPGLNNVIGSFNFLIVPVFVAWGYHFSLILTPVLFMCLYLLALWNYLGTLRSITEEVRAAFGQLNIRLSESLDGIETVKGASQEQAEVNRFAENAGRYRRALVRQGDVEARFLPMLLYNLALAFGLLHALILFNQGALNVGQVVGYFSTLLMLEFPVFASMFAYSQISLGLAGARRILELINRENNLDQNAAGYAGDITGEIEFRGVQFSYDQGEDSLSDLSFIVQPGSTVAIVGQTGSGKTTITKLVNRTYDVTAGSVLVDGIDVRDWNLEALRRKISIIEQDIFLYSDTIAANIAFGKPDATFAEIESAARSAQAHEFIQTFTDGYQTVIGDRGVTLSGGQRQRIALARAFLTNPRILILDDSTSAIDSATEDRIQRAIYTAARGRTTLIITHRLSQIRWADLIIVMRKGRIAAIGTHEELLKRSDAYRRIFSE